MRLNAIIALSRGVKFILVLITLLKNCIIPIVIAHIVVVVVILHQAGKLKQTGNQGTFKSKPRCTTATGTSPNKET